MVSELTRVREAVDTAIMHWPWPAPLVWVMHYHTDADEADRLLHDPGARQLPAIWTEWRAITPIERLQAAQQVPVAIRVAAYLPGDERTLAETAATEILRCLLQCSPATDASGASQTPYLRAACNGNQVRPLGAMTIEPRTIGRAGTRHVYYVAVEVTCPIFKDLYRD